MISKKELEILLSKLAVFDAPRAELEQYPTPSDIASELLWMAFMNGDTSGKKVADFGTGTGVFAIGLSLLGAEEVDAYDLDRDVIKLAKKNFRMIKDMGLGNCKISFKNLDIKDVKEKYDTLIMNPPFGIQKEHADRVFLEKAFGTAKSIYSIHRSNPETDKFILCFAEQHGFSAQKISEKNIALKATMAFHEKPIHSITVSLWKFAPL